MLPRSAPVDHPVAAGNGRKTHWMTFLGIAFTWSWSCWLLASVIKPQSALASGVLSALGSFGPGVAAVAVIGWTGGRPGLRGWLGQCLQWRIGVSRFAWAFFLPLTVLAPAALVHAAMGGSLGPSPVLGHLQHLTIALANLVLILMLGGPLGEEFGWRGWAWPALRHRHGWRTSSLILGGVWGPWHLPLFFIEGTLQSRLPVLPFLASTIALSVVFGWLSERSEGSVLPALTLHTAVNWWAWVIPGLLVAGHQREMALALGMLALLATGLLTWPAFRSGRPIRCSVRDGQAAAADRTAPGPPHRPLSLPDPGSPG
jgi:membrane protease YdiL (CAAX protease family)